MPGPLPGDLHVDALTGPVIGYRNPDYIYSQMFSEVSVKKQTDIVPQYEQSPWFRDQASIRARGTASAGGGFSTDVTLKYRCERYSFRTEIADEDRDNADEPWQLDLAKAMFVADKIQMRKEIAMADDFFKTGVWQTDKTGGTDFTKWSDYGASQPLVDMASFHDTIEGDIGMEANILAMGKQVWSKLRWHPDLIDLIKHTQIPDIQPERVATFGGFDKVLVGRAIKTTAVEGTAESSVTYTRVWGKNFIMLHVPKAPSPFTPSAGYTYVWNRVPGASMWIKRMRDEEREVDIIEGNTYFDQLLIVKRAGLFGSGAVD